MKIQIQGYILKICSLAINILIILQLAILRVPWINSIT